MCGGKQLAVCQKVTILCTNTSNVDASNSNNITRTKSVINATRQTRCRPTSKEENTYRL